MYAIVEIAGQQFKASKEDKLFVHRLPEKEGSKVSFDNVLLIGNGKKVVVGEPKIYGACVNAKVISHFKGDKIIIFKKKRRKGYRVKNGHRQFFTEVLIENVLEKVVPKQETSINKKSMTKKLSSKEVKSQKKIITKKVVSSKGSPNKKSAKNK